MPTALHCLPFNPLRENSYLLIDEETRETIIIDPGCSTPEECQILDETLAREKAKPLLLLATHLHFDHIWGIPYVAKKYNLAPKAHITEIEKAKSFNEQADSFMIPAKVNFDGIAYTPLQTGEILRYGQSSLEVLFTPGHTPGHITFYNRQEGFALCGDVVFCGNIGRCDLEGGSYKEMMNTLKKVFIPLPDSTILYPGHGPSTSIEYEKNNNPYIISQL